MDSQMWDNAVQKMKQCIQNDTEMYNFFINMNLENRGFIMETNENYLYYSKKLDRLTGDFHSGASFALCLRAALTLINNEVVVVHADEVNENDNSNLEILSPQ